MNLNGLDCGKGTNTCAGVAILFFKEMNVNIPFSRRNCKGKTIAVKDRI